MTMDQFRAIAEGYEGRIFYRLGGKHEIAIECKNTIYERWEDGRRVPHKVRCEISMDEDAQKLDGHEDTYSIIGGFGGMDANEKNLIRELERYGFEKKKESWEQMSLL